MNTNMINKIKPFTCVVAYCRQNMGIGNKGDLPWPMIKKDLKFFHEITSVVQPMSFDTKETSVTNLLFNSTLKQNIQSQINSQSLNKSE